MSEHWAWSGSRDIANIDVVSILTDSLVADNQLFVACLLVSHHSNVCVVNIQLGFVFQEEVEVVRVLLVEGYQEHSHFALVFVGNQVYLSGLVIVNNFFNASDIVGLVQIYPSTVFHVEVDTILS